MASYLSRRFDNKSHYHIPGLSSHTPSPLRSFVSPPVPDHPTEDTSLSATGEDASKPLSRREKRTAKQLAALRKTGGWAASQPESNTLKIVM